MIGEDIDEEIVDKIDAIETRRVLLGFMSKLMAVQRLMNEEKLRNPTNPPEVSQEDILNEEGEKASEYIETWRDARSARSSASSYQAHNISLRNPPDDKEIRGYLEDFKDTPHFKQVTQNLPKGSWGIKMVPLESIVAIQPSVAKNAHKDIPTSDDGLVDVFKYCLPLRGDQLLIDQTIQTPGNSLMGYQLVSRGPNIQVRGMQLDREKFEESGAVSIQFDIQPKINFVQVVNYKNRLILKNGYHRSFQLLREGETHIPAFVHGANRYEQTGGDKPGFFDESVVIGEDPPMVKDFLTEAAVDIDSPAQNKVIRVLAETTNMRR